MRADTGLLFLARGGTKVDGTRRLHSFGKKQMRAFLNRTGRFSGGMLAVFLALFAGTGARADATNYTGHYELADAKTDYSFSLDVTQTGASAQLSFSAAMADGSGAAPDGDGKGAVDTDGTLKFTFKDSFDNAGSGTLVAGKDGYHLTLNPTTVADPRALHLYADALLKKTAVKPSDP